MDKKVVHYIPSIYDKIEVGKSAIVSNVLDHPGDFVSNQGVVWTTPVLKVFKNGFETLNTRYRAVSSKTQIKRITQKENIW